ncbi:MAG: hypothetical protein V4671_17160 [Armatimonadota bacterium]
MNSNSSYRTTGIVIYWMAFLCLAFVIRHNIQNIVAKQTAQEQRTRQQEAKVAQEKEEEARRNSARTARSKDNGSYETSGSSEDAPGGTDRGTRSGSKDATSAVSEESEEWTDYHGSSLPIVFSHPPHWQVNESTTTFEGTVEKRIKVSGDGAGIDIMQISGTAAAMTPLARIEEVELKKQNAPSLQYVRVFLMRTAAFKDHPAVSWDYFETDNGVTRHISKFCFSKGADLWEIHSVAPADTYGSMAPRFKSVLDSLSFTSDSAGTDAAPRSLPSGFRKIDEEGAGISFHLPESWERTQSTNKRGEGFLTYASPDKEVSIIFWCKPDYEDAFVSATEDTIRALVGKNYDSQQTTIGGEKCMRWVYEVGGIRSINRVFRHDNKGYSLLFRLPKEKFSKWEATLDEVHSSFRFMEFPHAE